MKSCYDKLNRSISALHDVSRCLEALSHDEDDVRSPVFLALSHAVEGALSGIDEVIPDDWWFYEADEDMFGYLAKDHFSS